MTSAAASPVPRVLQRDVGMSHVLIVYASNHGQTLAIADAIASRLVAAGHEVQLANALAGPPPAPTRYDAVIIGSRIRMERHAKEIEHYARVQRAALSAMPTAFFSVSMSASDRDAGPDPHGYLEAFFRLTGWRPQRAIAFGGALRYRDYNVVLRFVMKQISRKAHHPTDTSRNHDCTNWAAVDRFADDLAKTLRPAGAGAQDLRARG